MQTKRRSAFEAVVNIGVGLVLSVLLNYLVLYIEGLDVTWHGMGILALVMTVASFVRQYVLRRIFNRWD
jgi:putative flippase GtrA